MANYKTIEQHQAMMIEKLSKIGSGYKRDMTTFITDNDDIRLYCDDCSTETFNQIYLPLVVSMIFNLT